GRRGGRRRPAGRAVRRGRHRRGRAGARQRSDRGAGDRRGSGAAGQLQEAAARGLRRLAAPQRRHEGPAPRPAGAAPGAGGRAMRIGMSEVFTGEQGRDRVFVRDAAQVLEGLGYNSIWFPEHVVFFESYRDGYPYGEQGGQEVQRVRGVYDPFNLVAAVAMVTERVRLGTYVCV